MRNKIQSICVLVVVALFASASVLSGEAVFVDMGLDPPVPGSNHLVLTLTADALGMSPEDSDSTDI
jgi:hypothetical protein